MATRRKTTNEIGFGAEQRAVEEGHLARKSGVNNVFLVKSDTSPSTYEVSWIVLGYLDNLVHFSCTCKSGQNRQHLPIPCKHAALVGRRLEREKIARWIDGLFYGIEEIDTSSYPSVDEIFEAVK